MIDYANSAKLAFLSEIGPGSTSEFGGRGSACVGTPSNFNLFSNAESYAMLVEAVPAACIPRQLIHLSAAPALSP